MYGSKVMTRNTFHGDHRPSLWRWRAQAGVIGNGLRVKSPPPELTV